MTTTEFIGTAAAASSIALASLGLPVQMYQVYEAKSTHGVSLLMIVILWVVYVLWTTYGVKLKNAFIWVPNGLGLICSSVFLIQFWLYRAH